MIAIVVSTISLRTVDDYFIIITLGIQVVIFSVMNNWQALTRGPLGIPGIPSIKILGFSFDDKISFLLLSMFFVGMPNNIAANMRQIIYGVILILVIFRSSDKIYKGKTVIGK